MSVSTQKSARGFTLLELLVVIAIIGLLSSVVLASLNSSRARSRDAKRMADLRQVQLALEAYVVDYGQYPTTGGNWWGTTAGCWGGHGQDAIPGLVSGGYISAIPEDPAPNAAAGTCYLYNSNGADYMFLAHGTVESFDPDGPPAHSMDRALHDQQSIAVWSPGAKNW